MLNSFSIMLTLAGLFAGVDRYYLHLDALASWGLPIYVPTALTLLGMLLGFCGMIGKSKKKRRGPFRCAVFGLIVCLVVTGLWLYQVLTGRAISFA